jgi:hypothetical protein
MPVNALPPVNPGTYPGPGQASLLRSNGQQYLFRQQLVAAGGSAVNGANASASIAIQAGRAKEHTYYQFAASIQIWFTDVNGAAAAPGTFEVDIQTSDVDIDGLYCNEQAITSVTGSAGDAARANLTLSWFTFIRVYVKTLTNAVYVNALLTR